MVRYLGNSPTGGTDTLGLYPDTSDMSAWKQEYLANWAKYWELQQEIDKQAKIVRLSSSYLQRTLGEKGSKMVAEIEAEISNYEGDVVAQAQTVFVKKFDKGVQALIKSIQLTISVVEQGNLKKATSNVVNATAAAKAAADEQAQIAEYLLLLEQFGVGPDNW